MEILRAPSGLATSVRPRYCRCFIVRSGCLSAPSPPSSFRVQIQFHPWSKQLFHIIPKAQSGKASQTQLVNQSCHMNNLSASAYLRRKVKGKEVIERLDKQLLEGVKPPYVEYLMGLGLDLDDIRGIVWKYCYIGHRSVDGQIRPFVEALRNFGMDHKRLLAILRRCPEAMRVSVEKKFLPTMAYLESLGLDKAQCVKAIYRYPQILTLAREKIEANVAYFLEFGVSAENVRKIIVHSPQLLGMSVERRIRRMTEFFLTNGFTKEELQRMVVRFPNIYCYSLTKRIIPKWEFFLEMGYPTSYLVNFPQYLGYSLEGRIKPRHKLAMEHGVRLHFSTFLSCTDTEFEMLLEKLVSRRSSKDGGNCST